MRRREFVTLLGSAASVWPLAVLAQQRTMPVLGYLNAASREANAHLVAAFQSSLADAGYVEGQNVTTQYRYGDGLYDRLPESAAELVPAPSVGHRRDAHYRSIEGGNGCDQHYPDHFHD